VSSGGMWCPKAHSSFYGDGTLKMYCFVAHFRLYADVTLKSGKLETPFLHPKVNFVLFIFIALMFLKQ
jgi:hypothetical protein